MKKYWPRYTALSSTKNGSFIAPGTKANFYRHQRVGLSQILGIATRRYNN